MTGFTDHAYKKMIDLYNNHSHEVGSQIASAYPDKTPTDCITYIINALKYAFDKTGNQSAVDRVGRLGEYGTQLLAYLVDTHGWKGIYYNPDVNHPRDGDLEHTYSYYKSVATVRRYYDISISHLVINYNPTARADPNYKSFSGIGGQRDPTDKDTSNFDKLKKIKFGVAASRGGQHTWLYSLGKVYEVHWDRIGPGLYEASSFETYPWLSGAIAVPPDAITAANFNEKSVWEQLLEVIKRWSPY